MIKKVLIFLLPLTTFLGGAVAGDMLHSGKTDKEEHAAADSNHGDAGTEDHSADSAQADKHAAEESGEVGWFSFPNQFFVPVVRNGNLGSTMILTITLETGPGTQEAVATKEHRLRDSMLRSLMIHANTGGFDGNFTAEGRLRGLREALLKAAQDIAGPDVHAVLIEDIVRQE